MGPRFLVATFALTVVGCRPAAEAPPAVPLTAEAVDLQYFKHFHDAGSTNGELIYVPIYSSIYHRSEDRQLLLAATLSVHNLDLSAPIRLTAVAYFDTHGRLLREMSAKPVTVGPLQTKHFVIPQADQSGGTGANFLVRWEVDGETPRPLVEALMVSTTGNQGISFTTQGTVIQRLTRARTSTTP